MKNTEAHKRAIRAAGKALFDNLLQLRKEYDSETPGWLTGANILVDLLVNKEAWANSNDFIALVQTAVSDLDKASVKYKDSLQYDILQDLKKHLVTWLNDNKIPLTFNPTSN